MLKLIDRYLVTMEDRVVFSDRSRHVRGREMLDAAALVDRIPQIDRIPSMDALFDAFRDLASRYPRLFRLRRIGTSRLGEPLIMLTTGRGPKQALLVGGPHPNEPIGFLTLLHLARRLADDADLRDGMGYAWNLIPCIDPDGARLNEGWYGGPMTIEHYHRHFYRPALRNQPEWTFPMNHGRAFFDRPLPETQALMRVIDELRPRFQYSLHNADFGAAYFVLSRDIPGLADKLAESARAGDIPLELTPSEAVGWQVAGPAPRGGSAPPSAGGPGPSTRSPRPRRGGGAPPGGGLHPPNPRMMPTMA